MSRLLARIMLALLMLPCAGLIYFVVAVILYEGTRVRDDNVVFTVCTLVAVGFIGVYWTALWWRTVHWSAGRLRRTVLALFAAGIIGVVFGFVGRVVDRDFVIFPAGVAFIISGLAFTVLAWRDTARERADRARMVGANVLACPACGYNMTGLHASACPECGATYTLDEFVALVSGREDHELDPASEE